MTEREPLKEKGERRKKRGGVAIKPWFWEGKSRRKKGERRKKKEERKQHGSSPECVFARLTIEHHSPFSSFFFPLSFLFVPSPMLDRSLFFLLPPSSFLLSPFSFLLSPSSFSFSLPDIFQHQQTNRNQRQHIHCGVNISAPAYH